LKTPSKPKWMLPLLLAIVCAAAPSANFSARQTSTSPQRTLQASPTKHEIDCLGFSDDGRTFFAGTLDSYATIWRTDDWRAIATIKPQPLSTKSGQKFRMIKGCAISPTGNTFALGSEGIVAIFSLPTVVKLEEIRILANSITYSPDGERLLIGSGSSVELISTRTWQRERGATVNSGLPATYSEVTALALSRDGSTVAAGSRTGTIDIWNMKRNLEARTLRSTEIKPGRITSISFSPDGLLLVAAIESFQPDSAGVYVWEVTSGKQIAKLDSAVDAAFSPDGNTLATVNTDGVAHLLDPGGWRERCHFATDNSSTVTYSPDSKWVVTGGGTAAASVWSNPPCR
jgi:WD40 repeat protein